MNRLRIEFENGNIPGDEVRLMMYEAIMETSLYTKFAPENVPTKDQFPYTYKFGLNGYDSVSNDRLLLAVDTLIAAMVEKRASKIVVDLDEHERSYRPAVKMTVEEIEKALGYKVEIISDAASFKESAPMTPVKDWKTGIAAVPVTEKRKSTKKK